MKIKNCSWIVEKEYMDYFLIFNRSNGKWAKISSKFKEEIDGLELEGEHKGSVINMLFENGIFEECKGEKTITISITNRCNLSCKHCCVSAGTQEEIEKYQLIDILEKCIRWKPERIVISGGEPLIRSDFVEIIQFLRKRYNGYLTLATNGILINYEMAKFIKYNFDQIDISIDGIDEETCALVRGKGVFHKVLNKIELLKSVGMEKITLSMVIGEYNKEIEEKFINLNKRLGTKPVIRGFSAVGRGKENVKLFQKEAYIGKITNEYFERKIIKCSSCKAGMTNLFIDYKGNVFPCMLLNKEMFYMGNVNEIDSFDELHTQSNIIDICLKLKAQKCTECLFNLLCWNCPAKLLELSDKDIKKRCDQLYPYFKEILERNTGK